MPTNGVILSSKGTAMSPVLSVFMPASGEHQDVGIFFICASIIVVLIALRYVVRK